jgi:hypothetical protein
MSTIQRDTAPEHPERPELPAELAHLSRTQARRLPYAAHCPICGQDTVHGPCDKTLLLVERRTRRGYQDLSDEQWAPTPAGLVWLAEWKREHPEQAAEVEAWSEAAVTRALARKREREAAQASAATPEPPDAA